MIRSLIGRYSCVASLLLLLLAIARANADTEATAVTVRLNAGSISEFHAVNVDRLTIFTRLESWVSCGGAGPEWPTIESAAKYDTIGWTNRTDHAGLEFINGIAAPARLRVVVRLPKGLWRADAAIVSGAVDPDGVMGRQPSPPRFWRMESLLLEHEGEAVRTIDLRPGQALFLRWTETGASAREARKAVRRACWTTSDRALQDRVSGALMPVDDILDALPTLVARGDRKKITTRIHTALLATAKAQALWDNGRGDSIADRDSAFTGLVTALSEVSCACFDLVPGETLIPAVTAGGKPEIRVTLTNAGSRTIPLVALGIDRRDGASQGSDRSVYRSVAPGATVIARFPTADPDAVRGIVQFLSDMGAATVSAAPAGPTMPSAQHD